MTTKNSYSKASNFLEISEIKAADFDSVKEIIFESKLIDEKLLNLENAVHFIRCRLENKRARIFIKKEDGAPVAFAVLYYKISTRGGIHANWHISYLYVQPAFRRKYIARKIIMRCIDFAEKSQAAHISLNTSANNYPAQKLYENFGFLRKNYISNYFYYEMALPFS